MFEDAAQNVRRALTKAGNTYYQTWFFIFACMIACWPVGAEASTLGAIMCNVSTTGSGYIRILGACTFIAGLFIGVKGFLLLKKHGENPNDSQVVKGTAHLVVGGLLMSFPAAVALMQESVVGKSVAAGNLSACEASGAASGAQGLDVMMQNFVTNVHGPIFILLSALSVIIGVTIIFKALLRGAKTGADPRAANPRDIVANLVIGAILISMGTMLQDVMATLFGSGDISNMKSFDGIQWSKITGSSANTEGAKNTVRAVLAFIQIIGGISFLRGWLIIKTAVEGSGQATVPQGVTHIVGGAMAINIDRMLKIIDSTFGTGIMSD